MATRDLKPRPTVGGSLHGQTSSGDGNGLELTSDKVVPVRYPGRWIAVAACGLLFAMLVNALVTNPAFQWDVVLEYLTADTILKGLWRTIELTIISMVIGIVLGIIAALMRLSKNPVLVTVSSLYIWFFRGTPVLVQLIFWFNLGALYQYFSVGVPFGPSFYEVSANVLITQFVAAILGLGLNEGAYMAEVVRAGILSVDDGQTEAAASLGMGPGTTMFRIVLPQAMRVILPPTGNEVITMLKATSLVSVISMAELLYSAQGIYGRTFQTIPLLIVVSIWYLLATTALSIVQFMIERHFGRGLSVRNPSATLSLLRLATRRSEAKDDLHSRATTRVNK